MNLNVKKIDVKHLEKWVKLKLIRNILITRIQNEINTQVNKCWKYEANQFLSQMIQIVIDELQLQLYLLFYNVITNFNKFFIMKLNFKTVDIIVSIKPTRNKTWAGFWNTELDLPNLVELVFWLIYSIL